MTAQPEMIREYTPADRDGLRALAFQCPQGDRLRIVSTFDDPMSRVQKFEAGTLVVAEDEGALVGTCAVGIKTLATTQGPVRMGYAFGMQVHPRHRRRKLASRLLTAIDAWLGERSVQHYYVSVLADNAASLALCAEHGARLLYEVAVCGWPLLAKRRERLRSEPEPLSPDQTRSAWAQHFSASPLRLNDWSSVLDAPSSQSWMVEDRGSMASISAWTSFPETYWIAIRRPRAFDLFAAFHNRVGPMLGYSAIPGLRQPIPYAYLYAPMLVGERGEQLMRGLLETVSNKLRARGCVLCFALVGAHQEHKALLPSWSALTTPVRLLEFSTHEGDARGFPEDWDSSEHVFLDPRDF